MAPLGLLDVGDGELEETGKLVGVDAIVDSDEDDSVDCEVTEERVDSGEDIEDVEDVGIALLVGMGSITTYQSEISYHSFRGFTYWLQCLLDLQL
jgi:hypothetical protein